MIKKLLVSTVALATLSTAAFAENDFGVGVGLRGDASVIKADINVDDNMRLEPFFSFVNSDLRLDTFSIGTAFHITDDLSKNVKVYYGGYLGIWNRSTGISTTVFNFGPVAGAEYYFDKNFSLGAEVNFNLGFGDATDIGTNSEVMVRYYF